MNLHCILYVEVYLDLLAGNTYVHVPIRKCGSRVGGGGAFGPDPPGKSQVIWASIGNKQLDPPGKS